MDGDFRLEIRAQDEHPAADTFGPEIATANPVTDGGDAYAQKLGSFTHSAYVAYSKTGAVVEFTSAIRRAEFGPRPGAYHRTVAIFTQGSLRRQKYVGVILGHVGLENTLKNASTDF